MLPTRTLGSQGLTVSALGLGLMGMTQAYGTADERDDSESIATIHRAIELGVTLFDTAEAYGPNKNEELLARALKQLAGSRDLSRSRWRGCCKKARTSCRSQGPSGAGIWKRTSPRQKSDSRLMRWRRSTRRSRRA